MTSGIGEAIPPIRLWPRRFEGSDLFQIKAGMADPVTFGVHIYIRPGCPLPSLDPAKTVLIVEDDPDLLRAIAFSMEVAGYDVCQCRTAQALERADVESAACLVIDERLPDGSGLASLARLRARCISTPALMITSDPSRTLLARAKDLQTPILIKPLLGEDLINAVRAVIADSSREKITS